MTLSSPEGEAGEGLRRHDLPPEGEGRSTDSLWACVTWSVTTPVPTPWALQGPVAEDKEG